MPVRRANGVPDAPAQFTTAEVAQLVHRSPAAVRELIRRGRLDATRLPGVGYRVPRAALVRLAMEVLLDETGRQLSERQVEQLIERALAMSREAASSASRARPSAAAARR